MPQYPFDTANIAVTKPLLGVVELSHCVILGGKLRSAIKTGAMISAAVLESF